MNTKEQIDKIVSALKRERDELQVQLKLGSAEAKEQWEELEKEIAKLTSKADHIGDVAEQTGEQVIEAAKLAVDEIKKGYERIRKML